MKVLIGIVGYYQFIRGYPLGPELMERLQGTRWPDGVDVRVAEMNWGPIAIVQDLQANPGAYERIVLIGAIDRGLGHGAVTLRRWAGGSTTVDEIQQRVFEAVTGIISLDNLLIIGEHFRVWPRTLVTVEAQLADRSLEQLVLDEIELDRRSGQMRVIGEQPLTEDNEDIVRRLVGSARRAALDGDAALLRLPALSAQMLAPVAMVCHHAFAGDASAARSTDGVESTR